MSLFLEKCEDAIRRTKDIWTSKWTTWGFWCAKNWYEVDLVSKDTEGKESWRIGVLLAIPFVSPLAYVILPTLNALMNLFATVTVWLAIPLLTIVHQAKENSRKEELLTRTETDKNSLIAQLSDDEKFSLGAKLDTTIIQYEPDSESSTQFKQLYCKPQNTTSLENKLKSIQDFITEENKYNAGRGISEVILSTLQKAQARLTMPTKATLAQNDGDEANIEEETSNNLGA